MDDEKKVKLEELPDEGSSSLTLKKPKVVIHVNKEQDPRLENLRELDSEAKLEVLSKTWSFDRPQYLFGWLVYIVAIILIQQMFTMKEATVQVQGDSDFNMAQVFSPFISFGLESLLKKPILLIFLTPIFFKMKKESPYKFVLTFDGIQTVDKISDRQGLGSNIVRFKWADIVGVEKGKENERDILIFNSRTDRLGVIIWDIKSEEKKAIGHLLRGLIKSDHPLRKFWEKGEM